MKVNGHCSHTYGTRHGRRGRTRFSRRSLHGTMRGARHRARKHISGAPTRRMVPTRALSIIGSPSDTLFFVLVPCGEPCQYEVSPLARLEMVEPTLQPPLFELIFSLAERITDALDLMTTGPCDYLHKAESGDVLPPE